MNKKDSKEVKSKKAKVKNTAEPVAKKMRSRAKIDDVVTVEEVVKTKKAKNIDDMPVEAEPAVKAKTVKAKAEPKVKKTKAKVDEVVQEKPVAKAKKTKAKIEVSPQTEAAPKTKKITAKTASAKTEPKTRKLQTKKVSTENEPAKFPLSAKIQTQENFDLIEPEVEAKNLSPVFKELAEPKLPVLREESRAFLQMQSPTRIFFYWSLKQNAGEILRRALGNRADDYFLAIRLVNLNTNQEDIHQVESKGSWWFNNIESDAKYRAEVGFYAPNRPFVRIVYSNTLVTPRLRPSENVAYQPYFAVTADQFAEVLDLAGFSEDAFEVYVAGDEPKFADEATQKAFVQLVGKGQVDFSHLDISELRYVLFALASGVSLYELREQVSGNLFGFLSALTEETLTEEKVILALEEFFGFSPFEESVEEFGAPTVFGASLINFPRRKKTAKFSPLSSFSLK